MENPELISASKVIPEITKDINNAKKRICVISTILIDDDTTEPAIKALKAAARRGVKVKVANDIFAYGELAKELRPFKAWKKRFNKLSGMRKSFRNNKVDFTWLGKAKFLIFTGRTHTKWVVIDDIVYCFGGINLYKIGLETCDYFFKFEDKTVANLLFETYKNILKSDKTGSGYKSHEIKYKNSKILIDGGFMGDSIIYKRACELAEKATAATLVTQYVPYGKLAKSLKKIDSKLYFNIPDNASFLNKVTIKFGMMRSGLKTDYKRPRYIHAKFIIFTMRSGKKIAISGSHNLVSGGVLLGTREIAIETSNPNYIKQLEKFIKQEII